MLIVVVNYYLVKSDAFNKILSPIGNSFSIFSILTERAKPKPKKFIYGYLPFWSLGQLKHLQLDKLTDISYFGLNINQDGTLVTKQPDGTSDPGYDTWKNDPELDSLITKAKGVGIRIALTIISHNDEVSNKFLDCRTCWETLYLNIVTELDRKNIKDINLNFEYVEFKDEQYSKKYTELVDFMNKKLDKQYGNSFVVVATFADALVKPRVTNVKDLATVADSLFIMGYDFHHPNSDKAGPVAPIEGKGIYADYDLKTTIADYLTVCPPSKLILGVPYYGYNWVVQKEEPYAKRIPGDDNIGYSQSQTYWQIMDTILELKPDIKYDDLAQAPYFTYQSLETGSLREVYFENDKSLGIKYQVVKDNKLAGIGIWALGYDGGYQELWDLLRAAFIK